MASEEDPRRAVDLDEVRSLLQRYFIGPISEQVVTKIHDKLARLLVDRAEFGRAVVAYDPAMGGRGWGLAWREEAFGRSVARTVDLVSWLAWKELGVPARPYCPDVYLGTWRQVVPAQTPPARWQFGIDGALSTTDEKFATRIRWCVHRQSDDNHVNDAIWLYDELGIAHKTLLVDEVTPNLLRFEAIGGLFENISYRLER